MTYIDVNAKQYEVNITVQAIKRIRAALDIDLFALLKMDDGNLDTSLFAQLAGDPVMTLSVAYYACDQARQDMRLDDWLSLFDADNTDEAKNKTLKEALRFFPLGAVIVKVMDRQEVAAHNVKVKAEALTAEQIDLALSNTHTN